jgi:hypothetical protein
MSSNCARLPCRNPPQAQHRPHRHHSLVPKPRPEGQSASRLQVPHEPVRCVAGRGDTHSQRAI